MNMDVTEILPRLWLGNKKSANDIRFLKKYNITNVLTVYEDEDAIAKYSGIKYLVIPIRDHQTCNVNFNSTYQLTGEFIKNALNDGSILVHCKKGHHRSAAVVAAYMIKHLKINPTDAILYINRRRPEALTKNKCMTSNLLPYYRFLNY